MPARPLLRSALLGFLLTSCTAIGGSEEMGGGEADTFQFVAGNPADGAPAAPVSATIVMTFSSPIDPASVTNSTVAVNHTTFGTLSVDGNKLTFDPAGDLLAATTYIFTISPELKGINGHALGVMGDDPYGFKTGGIAQDTLPTQGPRPR